MLFSTLKQHVPNTLLWNLLRVNCILFTEKYYSMQTMQESTSSLLQQQHAPNTMAWWQLFCQMCKTSISSDWDCPERSNIVPYKWSHIHIYTGQFTLIRHKIPLFLLSFPLWYPPLCFGLYLPMVENGIWSAVLNHWILSFSTQQRLIFSETMSRIHRIIHRLHCQQFS